MSRIIPVIMVSRSLIERLEKARAGLVQRRTWVNNSPSAKGHYRMQWVALGPSAGKEKDYSKQRDLFGEPAPKAEPAAPADALFGGDVMDKRNTVDFKPSKGSLSRASKFFEIMGKHYRGEEFPDRAFDNIFEMNDGDEVVVSIAREMKENPGKATAIIQSGNLEKAPSILQPTILKNAGRNTPEIVSHFRDIYSGSRKWLDEMPERMRGRAKEAKYQELKDLAEFAADMYQKTVDKINSIAGKEEKPAPKAGLEDVRKMSDDALDAEHLKLFPKFNEVQKLKGYRYQEDHEKVMPYSDYQRMRDVMNEMLRRSEIERENLKEYPGLTKDETWFIISTKKMIDKMKKQNGGEISPEKLKDMSHMINWMRKLESKIKEPEKTVEKPNAAEKPESGDDSKDHDLTIGEQYARKGAVNAKADGMWVVYFDKDGKQMGTKKIGSAGEARDEAEMFNRDYAGEKPAASTENKAYPGLTNKEIMELITSRNTLGLMEKQYKGSVAPRVKKEMSALQDRIREIESKIREPEKPAEKPAKEEKPKAGDYKIYHDSFTGVVDEVINNLDKKGLYLSEEDLSQRITLGPGKPKDGRTDRYSIPLFDSNGKPAGKAAHFQVYDMGNGKYELNLYTSPLKKTEYEGAYLSNEPIHKPKNKSAGGAEEKPTDSGKPTSEKDIADEINAISARDMFDLIPPTGRLSNMFAYEDEMKVQKKAAIEWAKKNNKTGDAMTVFKEYLSGGKKPFEEMTFKERNKPGLPENVAETVRDVLGVSSGTAANYAGSNKYDDIDKFKYAAAKWAYENDKVGSASDILDQYARHKGIRKSILDTFRDGLAKAFGGR